MAKLSLEKIKSDFQKIRGGNPILFLDYDGTLVPIITDPENSYPDPELISNLDSIGKELDLYIVTGRSLREMRNFLGDRYNILALHGAVMSRSTGEIQTVEGYEDYRRKCDQIFGMEKKFESEFPGVHLINKDGGVVFTKWYLDKDLHRKLDEEICSIAEDIGMSCYIGKMIVEIRIPGPNKGAAIKKIRNGRPALIAGDDRTDEDAFRINSDAFTIKIGDGSTSARYRVKDYLEFRKFLSSLQA